MADVETVPLAAYESQASRFARIIKYLIIGWAVSMVAFGLVLVISLSYTEEVITETETVSDTQTLERVAQADNQGNAIVGDGDISIGDSTSNTNSYENDDADEDDQNDEEGSSGGSE